VSTSGELGSDRPAAEPAPECQRADDPLDRPDDQDPAVDGPRRSPADEPSGFTSLAEQLLRLKRELLATQNRLEQQGTQLSLALSLPRFFVRDRPEHERLRDLCKALTIGLGVQRVRLLTVEDGGLTALVPSRHVAPQAVPPRTHELLAAFPSGYCNDPEDERFAGLATAVALGRFLWSRVTLQPGKPPALLVAGFEAGRAPAEMAFDSANVVLLDNLARQIGMHAANLVLLNELEREKSDLQALRSSLEQQVLDRTAQVTETNEHLMSTFKELEDHNNLILADLEEAKQFQTRILSAMPEHPGLSLAASYGPLDLVGGDVYNVSRISPDVVRVFLADATGHGVQASLRTILIASEYERLKLTHPDPQILLEALNQRLVTLFPDGSLMATASCLDIELGAGGARLRLADAGNPPVIRITRGMALEISAPGTLLGVIPDARFGVTEMELGSGDVVVVCSDGLVEAMNDDQRSYELDGPCARRLLREGPDDAQAFLDRLHVDFKTFLQGNPLKDDLTVIVAQIR
jgi:serine phosphatase RsbU (regulator of sigma subunit)